MQVQAIKTRIFKEGEDLGPCIEAHMPTLGEGSVVVIASKIVALAENRTAPASEKERLIKDESTWAKQILPKWWLTARQGVAIVNAGIDESNSAGKLILLPEDCFASATRIRRALMAHFDISKCGVVITDSRVAPLRAGVTGVALGYAGFRGVRDYRGMPDIFGKAMEVTQTNVADSLATAATLVMGEGSEQQPLAIIIDAPVEFIDTVDAQEVLIDPKEDIYRDLFV